MRSSDAKRLATLAEDRIVINRATSHGIWQETGRTFKTTWLLYNNSLGCQLLPVATPPSTCVVLALSWSKTRLETRLSSNLASSQTGPSLPRCKDAKNTVWHAACGITMWRGKSGADQGQNDKLLKRSPSTPKRPSQLKILFARKAKCVSNTMGKEIQQKKNFSGTFSWQSEKIIYKTIYLQNNWK